MTYGSRFNSLGIPSRAVTLVAVAALVVAACGDDAADRAAPPSADDVAGRTFVSTATEGESLVPATEIRLTFDDGTLSVNAGCNTLTGGFSIESGELRTVQMASTMMACDEGLTRQDEWVSAFMQGSPTVAYADGVLTLESGSTRVTLAEES